MRMLPWEEDRLQLFVAAELARRHRAAGILLSQPEVVALICDEMLEAARAGRSYAEVEAAGRAAVEPGEAMDGVRELVTEIRLEVLLGDGSRVIALLDPLGRGAPRDAFGPGAIVAGDDAAREVNAGREAISIDVTSTSRRRIRVSSHYPFHRVNPRLELDRDAARGFHLDLPSGAWEGWEPGETKTVRLVRYGGAGGDDEEPPG